MCPSLINGPNSMSINVWNVTGALHNPKVMTVDSYNPRGVLKAIFHSSPSHTWILLYPHHMSNLVKNRAPNSLLTSSGMSGIGAVFLTVIVFSGQ